MVKTPPIPRYGGRGTEAIRLIQRPAAYRRGDEFEAPRDTDAERHNSKIAFLDPNQLSSSVWNPSFAASPILKVEPISFFLGAVSVANQRNRSAWYYRTQWVFFDAAIARKTMEAEYGSTRQVLVFGLPGLVFHMEDTVLLVAELNTNEPFRQAFDTLRPAYDTAASPTVVTYFRPGPFCPKTLHDAVGLFLAGTTAKGRKSWLFALMPPPQGRKKGRAFPPPALAYTVARRGYAKNLRPQSRLAAKVKIADLRWTRHALGALGAPRASADEAICRREAPMDKYVRQLVALSFPSR